MATIEERAKEYMHGDIESPVRLAMYEAYIDGAKDQKAIDDEEWRKDMRYMNIRKQALIDKAFSKKVEKKNKNKKTHRR